MRNSKYRFELLLDYRFLIPSVTVSDGGYANIDFKDPAALRALTCALLKDDWDLDAELREDRLCPTVRLCCLAGLQRLTPDCQQVSFVSLTDVRLTNTRLDYLLHVLDLEKYLNPPPAPPKEDQAAPAAADASPSRNPLRVLDMYVFLAS